QFAEKPQLGSDIVTKILVAADNSLWVLTSRGISHLQNGKIHNYTAAEGLSSDRVSDIHLDSRGTLWIATQGGLDRLDADRIAHVFVNKDIGDIVPSRFFEDSKG